jgi:superfamily II DNA or RNA helicase
MNLHKNLSAYLASSKFNLRPLQVKALDSTLVSQIGQVFLPTATGKTIVEVLTTLDCLLKLQDEGKTGVAVFGSHRILLNEQLLSQLIKWANGLGLSFDVLTVASDGLDSADVADLREGLGDLLKFCRVENTTIGQKIVEFVETSKKSKRHTLIVSTYQSFDRIKEIPKIDIACMDEAHTIVHEDMFSNVQAVLDKGIIDRIFYFTATPVHGYNGRGMDNHKVFGPELVKITPREAIDTGDILAPVLHKITITGGQSTAAIIKGAYLEHRKKVQELNPNQVARLLVSAEGVEEMIKLVTKKSFQDWAKQCGIRTVAFSSGHGYYTDGVEVNRKQAFGVIKEVSKLEVPLILFHYDILTEGIDLPNLTGVLPLRELDEVKFLQTCGRAARLTPKDREFLLADPSINKSKIGSDSKVELNPGMIKPCYWVLDALTNKAESAKMVTCIRTAYELEPYVHNMPDTSTTSTPQEADSVLTPPLTKAENESKTHLEHEFEIYRVMSLVKNQAGTGVDKLIKELETDLDQMLQTEPGETNHAQEKEYGNCSSKTSMLEADRLGTSKSDSSNSVHGEGSLTGLLGY